MDRRNRRRWQAGVAALAVVAAIAVWLLATRLFPYHSLNHDEAVYLQQAGMILDGQLFLYPPVEDAFRPWFFVEDGARLYSKYSPVTAAIFALGLVVGLPRVALAGVAAATVALVALVVREVFDRPTGLVAAALVVGSPLFLIDSAVFLPYAPTTMLNLAFLYCYLRANPGGHPGDHPPRDSPGTTHPGVPWGWGAGAGGFVGLAFFARPYTALLFALPVIGHACWTLREDWRDTLPRHAITAAFGLAGVGATLGYNAVMTGSPLRFPYEVFAPRDGLGFGEREILGYSIEYTVDLALRANALVLEQFATRWVAGGILGTGLAIGGLALTLKRGISDRAAILAGQVLTITAGNVYFWGNRNILGDLDRATDGLIVSHGPYYHFDLLVPVGAFAAVALVALVRMVRRRSQPRLDHREVSAAVAVLLLVSAGVLGGITASNAQRPVQYNSVATDTYEEMYEPVERESFENALVFLPTPYGDWLNHPFQALRNDPGFDGRVVYAMDERPFEVLDAVPNRTLYRFTYRGDWAPYTGSPRASRLQPVDHVEGATATLNVTMGLPTAATSVTTTVITEADSHTYIASDLSDPATFRVRFTDDEVRVVGGGVGNESIPVGDDDSVRLTLFVDRGPGASFSYELDVPVQQGETTRLLTPRIERCVAIGECRGDAGYIPANAPEDTYIETELEATDS